MNPIAGIESNIYDEQIIEYNTSGGNSMSCETLFDSKFDALKNTFVLENEHDVYEFIKIHENIFNLLEEVKPYLKKHFSDAKYFLEVRCYPELYEDELALVIKLDYSKEDMEELIDRISYVDLKINKYIIELGLLGKFYIIDEGI